MKLRLASRLMVLTLVVVVGVIIIIHEHAAAGSGPHTPRATPTVTSSLSAGFPYVVSSGGRRLDLVRILD